MSPTIILKNKYVMISPFVKKTFVVILISLTYRINGFALYLPIKYRALARNKEKSWHKSLVDDLAVLRSSKGF